MINSDINQATTIEFPNSQGELNKDNTIPVKIENDNNSQEFKKEEEHIIIYSEKVSQELIILFYEKMIEILYNLSLRKNFITLVKSLNESYLYNTNIKKYPKTKETEEFFNSFKYSSIIIICLIFLTKDIDLYNNSNKKIKENLEQFIYSCLEMTNMDIIVSLKILNFVGFSRKVKKSLYNCTNQIIKIIFKKQNIISKYIKLFRTTAFKNRHRIYNRYN